MSNIRLSTVRAPDSMIQNVLSRLSVKHCPAVHAWRITVHIVRTSANAAIDDHVDSIDRALQRDLQISSTCIALLLAFQTFDFIREFLDP